MDTIPNSFMEEIKNGAREIGEKHDTQGNVIAVSDGKNYDAI